MVLTQESSRGKLKRLHSHIFCITERRFNFTIQRERFKFWTCGRRPASSARTRPPDASRGDAVVLLPQACAAEARRVKPRWPIRSLKLWTFPGWFCSPWTRSTRWELPVTTLGLRRPAGLYTRPCCCVFQVLNNEEQELAATNEYNFDHPDAFDFELLVTVLRKLKKGKSIKVPVYDFTTHSRSKEWVRCVSAPPASVFEPRS